MIRILSASIIAWGLCGASIALAQVKLEFKYSPNTQSSGVEHINSAQTLKIAGQNIETKNDSKIGARVEYLPPADNLVPVRITTESIVVNSNLGNGQTFTFDSANPNTKTDNPMLEPVLDALRVMVGSSLTYQLGADGKVARVDGLQAVLGKAPATATKFLETQLNEQRLKEAFEQQAGAFPDTPVNKGDNWKRTEDWHIEGGQTLSFDRTYEYVGTEDKDGKPIEKIKVTDEAVRYQIGANMLNLTLKESDLKIESSEGTLLFDRELGAVIERTITSRITGKMTFLFNGQELPAELDLKITRATERKK